MKKFFTILLAILMGLSALAACAESGGTNVSGFSPDDYRKLSALQFDGYETMSVSEYRKRVCKLTDTSEYRTLLERFFANQRLYQMRSSDAAAAFLFYVLQPLTAENWRAYTFNGAASSESPYPAENAFIEYSYTINVLNADRVRVRDYYDFGSGIRERVMARVLRSHTAEELRDEAQMRAEIDADLKEELAHIQTPDISALIEYTYLRPSEDDYRALLTLKTPDYQDKTIADFNAALQKWANEDGERMERIARDLRRNEFGVNLNRQETEFVACTVLLSCIENGVDIWESVRGRADGYIVYEALPDKQIAENGHEAQCSLHYQFSYRISDPKSVTVGERDCCIGNLRNAVYKFWDKTDVEAMLQMNRQDVAERLQALAKECSTENIIISVDAEQVQYERQ